MLLPSTQKKVINENNIKLYYILFFKCNIEMLAHIMYVMKTFGKACVFINN